MPTVLTQEGMVNLADWVAANYTDFHIRLYKNDYTPVEGSVLADFTEADFSGYFPVVANLLAHEWDAGRGQGKAQWGITNFNPDGPITPQTIYGWYVTMTNRATGIGDIVLCAKRLDTPALLEDMDDIVIVQPTLYFGPCVA